MWRMVERGPQRGERIDDLTCEALEAWFATERDARRLAWLADRLGPGVEWRRLGLATARVAFEDRGADGWGWQPTGDDRTGAPAILVPVWLYEPGAWQGSVVADLLAVDVREPERVASRTQNFSALGEIDVDLALADQRKIIWHRDAMGWLRAGGDARRLDGLSPDVAHFFPFVDGSAIAERVLLGASAVLGVDDRHALELEAAAQRARRLAYPRPRFAVCDAGVAA
jgi:hypothetical protein